MEDFQLTTGRLILREFRTSDAGNLYLLNSDPDVIRYTGDPPFKNVSDAYSFLAQYNDYKIHGMGRWAVTLKKGDHFVGWCGLKVNEQNLIDLGYRFFQEHWGKGYATESARACLIHGFHTLKCSEITGRAVIENKASIHVLKKLGMTYWKKDTCKGCEDAAYFKITKKEFEIINAEKE